MESTDNKTPRAVSGRPSLLSTPAGGTPDKNSQTRMLASLERDGKMPGSVSPGNKPSRKKYGIAALAVVLFAGVGAFFASSSFDDASASVATAPRPRVISVTAAEHPASATLAAAASLTASAASASAAAARIEFAAASIPEAVSAATTVALAKSLAASQPQVNPLDKLALRDVDSPTPPAQAAATPVARKGKPHGKDGVGAKAQAVASAKPVAPHSDAKAPAARKVRKAEDDADTELVAAIIARLDRRGAKPAATAPAPAVASEATPANVAGQVHQCSSNSDLVEARQCRNKACDGHWGKVDACPAARAPKTSRGDGADSGQRG